MILNGPFGDLRGKFIGEDRGYTDAFSTLPLSEIEWTFTGYDYSSGQGNKNNIVGFKAKDFNLVWCGDGGIGSGDGSTSAVKYPVALDADNRPSTKLYGEGTARQYVENARYVANLFCWAFHQAEFNGINTK